MSQVHKGSCLCGAVAYEVQGPLRPILYCHCTQCRKTTGHYLAATAAAHADFRMVRSDGLSWYRSSAEGERAFCHACGSTLFWQGKGMPYISIAAGTLDGRVNLAVEGHIFCANKGDYYEIPANEGYRRAQWET